MPDPRILYFALVSKACVPCDAPNFRPPDAKIGKVAVIKALQLLQSCSVNTVPDHFLASFGEEVFDAL